MTDRVQVPPRARGDVHEPPVPESLLPLRLFSFRAANNTSVCIPDTPEFAAWVNRLTQYDEPPLCTGTTAPTVTMLTLSAAPAPAEGGNSVTVTATLDNPAPANGITVTLTTGGTATLDTDYTLSSTTITLAEGPEADLGYGMLGGDRLVGMTSFGIEASVRQEPESVGRRSSKQCCTVKKSLTGQVYVCKTPRNHNRFCWTRGLHRPPIA